MDIGSQLKESRELKKLTLDDIQEITKIQKRYLEAIEENNFSVLPGKFYARAFIREYAEALDMDPDELLSRFKPEENEIEEPEPVAYSRMDRSSKIDEQKAASIFSHIPTLIVVLLVIAIIVVAWMSIRQAKPPEEIIDNNETDEVIREPVESPEDKVEKEVADEDENDENDEEKEQLAKASFEVVEVGEGQSPESTVDFNYTSDKVELEFEVKADSYLELRGDSGEVYYSDILSANSSETIYDLSSEEKVYLNIGNASGITFKINDEAFEYPVDPDAKVHQKYWINLNKN